MRLYRASVGVGESVRLAVGAGSNYVRVEGDGGGAVLFDIGDRSYVVSLSAGDDLVLPSFESLRLSGTVPGGQLVEFYVGRDVKKSSSRVGGEVAVSGGIEVVGGVENSANPPLVAVAGGADSRVAVRNDALSGRFFQYASRITTTLRSYVEIRNTSIAGAETAKNIFIDRFRVRTAANRIVQSLILGQGFTWGAGAGVVDEPTWYLNSTYISGSPVNGAGVARVATAENFDTGALSSNLVKGVGQWTHLDDYELVVGAGPIVLGPGAAFGAYVNELSSSSNRMRYEISWSEYPV